MLFNSGVFFVFFSLVFVSVWSISHDRVRLWILLAASYVFYGWWDVRFLSLILFVTVVTFYGALGVERAKSRRIQHWVIGATVVTLLAVLFIFKYFGFFLDSLERLGAVFGWQIQNSSLEIILPVGISFYTFQAISYVVDVYRKHLPPDHSLLEVALYITFFPQLVAGPIIRGTDFLPQLKKPLVLDQASFLDGIRLFLIGFCYKAVIADNLARIADPVFSDVGAWDVTAYWVATLAYTGQIYFDFAGYSGMAIGIARLLGFWLPINFNFPYSAASITDFWRRWHISLSTWLRDYLYIPLGGNRGRRIATYRNLMLTMLLGGLWHGASWNFVLWGAMHGLALAVHKIWTQNLSHDPSKNNRSIFALQIVMGFLLTQLWVMVAWVFFRAESFDDSLCMLGAMFGLMSTLQAAQSYAPLMLVLVLLPIIVDTSVGRMSADRQWSVRLPSHLYAVFLGALLAGLLWALPLTLAPFIYFQF